MSAPLNQPKLRASILYLGSALFLATGAVTIADQVIPNNSRKINSCNCTQNANNLPPGGSCSPGGQCLGRNCSAWKCTVEVLTLPNFVSCTC